MHSDQRRHIASTSEVRGLPTVTVATLIVTAVPRTVHRVVVLRRGITLWKHGGTLPWGFDSPGAVLLLSPPLAVAAQCDPPVRAHRCAAVLRLPAPATPLCSCTPVHALEGNGRGKETKKESCQRTQTRTKNSNEKKMKK